MRSQRTLISSCGLWLGLVVLKKRPLRVLGLPPCVCARGRLMASRRRSCSPSSPERTRRSRYTRISSRIQAARCAHTPPHTHQPSSPPLSLSRTRTPIFLLDSLLPGRVLPPPSRMLFCDRTRRQLVGLLRGGEGRRARLLAPRRDDHAQPRPQGDHAAVAASANRPTALPHAHSHLVRPGAADGGRSGGGVRGADRREGRARRDCARSNHAGRRAREAAGGFDGRH